jgi:iron complex outermembrane receptor protein
VYRNENEGIIDGQVVPPGFVGLTPIPPDFYAVWPDGVISNGGGTEASRTGIEIQTTYKISDSNTIVAGGTYEHQKAEELTPSANYLPTPIEGVLIPLPSVQKWPDDIADQYLMDEETRNLKAVFFEDVWDITDDLRLTVGARYDHYDDFGDHFSPRAGLTWEFMKGYDLKLLYGHAFRAPNFFEFYSPGSGNSDLDPEKIDTYEISLGAEFTRNFNSRITYYYREAEDLILMSSGVAPFNFVNQGESQDQGIELEMRYDFGRGTYLAGNYTYYQWKTAPERKVQEGKVMANVRLSKYLNFYTDYYFKDFIKFDAEPWSDWPGYEIVNVTLIAKKFLKGYKGLELRGSVYNLLDEDYAFPWSQEIPDGMPQPDRHYLFEVKYKF